MKNLKKISLSLVLALGFFNVSPTQCSSAFWLFLGSTVGAIGCGVKSIYSALTKNKAKTSYYLTAATALAGMSIFSYWWLVYRTVDEKLMDAIQKNNHGEIRQAINDGANIHNIGHGTPALVYAANQPRVTPATLQVLIDLGAKIDDKDEDDRTALMKAADWGSCEHMEFLIKKGAALNLISNKGSMKDWWAQYTNGTALHKACTAHGHAQLKKIKLLIYCGADTQLRNDYDNRAHEVLREGGLNQNDSQQVTDMLNSPNHVINYMTDQEKIDFPLILKERAKVIGNKIQEKSFEQYPDLPQKEVFKTIVSPLAAEFVGNIE